MENSYITQRSLRWIIFIVCLFTVLCTLTVYIILNDRFDEHERLLAEFDDSSEDVAVDALPEVAPLYVVGLSSSGGVGVFDADDGSLLRLLGVEETTLPESDKKLLRDGIRIYTDDELCSVIADYTG